MSIDALLPSLRPPGIGAPGIFSAVSRTSLSLQYLESQIALGRAMLSASDDPARSAALARLTASLDASLHRNDLLGRATEYLEATDGPLARAIDLLTDSRALASVDTTATLPFAEREAIAAELEQLVHRLVTEGNTRYGGVHLFGGTRPGSEPWLERLGGVLYMGRGRGLDIGLGEPVTLSGDQAFGGVSRRVELMGTVDLSAGLETPLAAWGAGALGTIRVRVLGVVQDVDLSGATTLRDLKNAIEGLDMGLRVEFDAASGKAWVRNMLSGPWFSISDITNDDTASRLGIDTYAEYTLLSDFNDGRGVRFAVPGIDPVTGEPSINNGEDIHIILLDGRTFNVDFTNEVTVGDVINTINAAAAAAGIGPGEFSCTLRVNENGLMLTDSTLGGGAFSVTAIDNSWALVDLGFEAQTMIPAGSRPVIEGGDRATVAVDGAFTWLLRLRDAVLAGDASGIKFALDGLDRAETRASSARGLAGSMAARFAHERDAVDEIVMQQRSLKSLLGDVDIAEASTRLSSLSVQLQAGLLALARAGSLSLLRYLG